MALILPFLVLVVFLGNFGHIRCPSSNILTQNASGIPADFGPRGKEGPAAKSTTANQVANMDFGESFNGPPSDGRTSDVLGFNIASGIPNIDPVGPGQQAGERSVFPFAPPMPLLPVPLSNRSKEPVSENSSVTAETVYIQVKIVYRKPSLKDSARTSCQMDNTDMMYIDVKAEGRNYIGVYYNHTTIDVRRSDASAMVPLAVKLFGNSTSEVLLTALDGCGRSCQAQCLDGQHAMWTYSNCDGRLHVTRDNATVDTMIEGPVRKGVFEENKSSIGLTGTANMQFLCPKTERIH